MLSSASESQLVKQTKQCSMLEPTGYSPALRSIARMVDKIAHPELTGAVRERSGDVFTGWTSLKCELFVGVGRLGIPGKRLPIR